MKWKGKRTGLGGQGERMGWDGRVAPPLVFRSRSASVLRGSVSTVLR
jgi:hypothetical protein